LARPGYWNGRKGFIFITKRGNLALKVIKPKGLNSFFGPILPSQRRYWSFKPGVLTVYSNWRVWGYFIYHGFSSKGRELNSLGLNSFKQFLRAFKVTGPEKGIGLEVWRLFWGLFKTRDYLYFTGYILEIRRNLGRIYQIDPGFGRIFGPFRGTGLVAGLKKGDLGENFPLFPLGHKTPGLGPRFWRIKAIVFPVNRGHGLGGISQRQLVALTNGPFLGGVQFGGTHFRA